MGKLHDAAPTIYDENDQLLPGVELPGEIVPLGRFIFRRGTKLRALKDDYLQSLPEGYDLIRLDIDETITDFLNWLDTQP